MICLSSSTSSPGAWAIAKKWIHDCRTTHEACKRTRGDWFPTRLLDLENSTRLRVVETASETPTESEYMTLSHRWSPQPSLLLCKDTKNELLSEQGFNTTRLPAAIQDAVTVCRRLGVRYIWVDTLCIVQDDQDLADWKRESALMGKVYENSLLNLSALAAADTEHSFFADRDPRVLLRDARVHMRLRCDVLELGDVMNKYQLVETEFWSTCINQAPLNKRSWVMQERLLAVRVLHFGDHQLLWECVALKAAETYPYGLPSDITTSISSSDRPLEFRKFVGEGALQKLLSDDSCDDDALAEKSVETIFTDAYEAWNDVVSGYSQCKATKGSDKLIAISGLAKHMASLVDDQYLVGMWRRHLGSDLLWYCVNSGMSEAEYPGPRRSRTDYRAPSFSWASVDAIVRYSGFIEEENVIISIMDVKLDFVTDDFTGLCRSGHLVFQGRLQRAIFTHKPRKAGDRTLRITGSDGVLLGMTNLGLDELPSYFEPVGRHDLYGVAWAFHPDEFLSEGPQPTIEVEYILFHAVDPGVGVFQRIGSATYTCYDEDRKSCLSAGPEAAYYPCLMYKDGQPTIKVI